MTALAWSRRHPVVWLSAAVVLAGLLFPSPALAADPPGQLEDTVVAMAEQHARGTVEWARYVEASADDAASLLGKSRGQLQLKTPDRVYLVVLRGDFSGDFGTTGAGADRAPYLAFLYWSDGRYWQGTDFTLLQRAVPMESVGEPRAVRPFALVHPTLNKALEYLLATLVVFGPAVLLAVSAFLCARKRRSRWPFVLAACAAVAVAAWQTFLALWSMSGQSWDPVFHGVKLGALAVVVGIDLAAAVVVLRARPRRPAGMGPASASAAPRRGSLVLLTVAAILSVLSWYVLATTGE